jgi:hypothetical protein
VLSVTEFVFDEPQGCAFDITHQPALEVPATIWLPLEAVTLSTIAICLGLDILTHSVHACDSATQSILP